MASSTTTVGFVTPTRPGSLGDQAMLEGATSYVIGQGHKACVFPDAPRLRSGAWTADYGGPLKGLVQTGQGVLRSGAVVYIGADVLDGSYSYQAVLKRLRVLRTAHSLGRQTRVMGASWSKEPAGEVIAFLKAAPWLEVLARDPVSQGRMERDLGRDIRLVADLAFLAKPAADSPASQKAVAWAREARAAGATVLAANLSGHTIRTLPEPSVQPFAALIARWLDADPARRVLTLPHDVRPGFGGDLTVCAALAESLTPNYADRMYVPDGPLAAWEAKAIAAEVDLVFTGRMHLAIAALGSGTPAVSVTYRDKFEGLLAHFNLDGLTMTPQSVGHDPEADQVLAAATDQAPALSAQINSALPGIKALSTTNFDGLLGKT